MKPKRLKNGKREQAGFIYEKIDHKARGSATEVGERPQFHMSGAHGSPERAALGRGSSRTSH